MGNCVFTPGKVTCYRRLRKIKLQLLNGEEVTLEEKMSEEQFNALFDNRPVTVKDASGKIRKFFKGKLKLIGQE